MRFFSSFSAGSCCLLSIVGFVADSMATDNTLRDDRVTHDTAAAGVVFGAGARRSVDL